MITLSADHPRPAGGGMAGRDDAPGDWVLWPAGKAAGFLRLAHALGVGASFCKRGGFSVIFIRGFS